jgi:hypothetical protein
MHPVAAAAIALLFKNGLATGCIAARRHRIEFAHRSHIRDKGGKLAGIVSPRGHGRPGDAGLEKAVEIAVTRRTPELAAAQIHSGHGIAVRAVAGDAIGVVEVEAQLHVHLRILADVFLGLQMRG